MKTLIILVLGLAALGLVAGCSNGEAVEDAPAAKGVSEVTVEDMKFTPRVIEVPVGTTVTWRWEGENEHNVVGDGFEPPVQKDGQFVYTFAGPGTYDYRCTLHVFMRGEVVVTA